MGYHLGVDVGTTYTAAAVYDGGQVEMLQLGAMVQVPSAVFVSADGELLVGDAAERRGVAEPGRLVREFKRRIGDSVPILVDGAPHSAQALVGSVLRWVVGVATTRRGAPPDHVTVTHPANWAPSKVDLLNQAIRLADLRDTSLCTEPEAAAIRFASRNSLRDGEIVAVYDLGGGTFDAAVLRRAGGRFDLLGSPEGIEHLGGVDFDEALFRHVAASAGEALAAVDPSVADNARAMARLRRDCVEAKERLSTDTEATVRVSMPTFSTLVRITRGEFQEMVMPAITDSIGAMRRALASADVAPGEVSAFVLVGGSSRIPTVGEQLGAAFGRPLALDTHPKYDVALGAALAAAIPARTAAPAPPPPPAGPPPALRPVVPPPTPVAVAAAAPLPASRASVPIPAALPALTQLSRSTVVGVAVLVLAVGGTAFGVAKVLNRHSGGTPNPQALSSAAPTVVPTYDAASAATPAAGVSCNLSGPSTSAYPNRILRRGMGSADSPDVDVIRVQHWLKLRGATTSCVDGIFGVQTEQLVSLFQRDNNLTISGVVDQQTWNVLFGLSPAPAAADACVAGYVWRLARPTDHVCVTESTREQVIADNTEGPSRVDPNGQAGPNTCIIPYVWRKAFPEDMVCVAPPVHDQAQHDNAEAPFRVRHRG